MGRHQIDWSKPFNDFESYEDVLLRMFNDPSLRAKYRGQGLGVLEHIAACLGVSKMAVNKKLGYLREQGRAGYLGGEPDIPDVTILDKKIPPKDFPQQLLKLIIDGNKLLNDRDVRQEETTVLIDWKGWIGLPIGGDFHLEHYRTNALGIVEDLKLIGKEPHVFFGFNGDMLDVINLRFLELENETLTVPIRRLYEVIEYIFQLIPNTLFVVCGCFAPGTEMLMKDFTYKPIVDVGTFEDTPFGFVRTRYANWYDGDMIKFKVKGNNSSIVSTVNHPVFGVKRKDLECFNRSDGRICHGEFCGKCSRQPAIKKIRADNLEVGDLVLQETLPLLSCSEYSEDWFKFAGWYLAEGCVSETCVSLTFGSHEQDGVDEVTHILKGWGYSPSIRHRRDRNTIDVVVTRKNFADKVSKLFGSSCDTKHIPFGMFDKLKLPLLLNNLVRGDGHRLKSNNGQIQLQMTSKALMEQVSNIVRGLGFWTTFRTIKRKNKKVVYEVRWLENRKQAHIFGGKGFWLVPVVSVENVGRYTGFVFNTNIDESHKYVVDGVSVGNCHDNWVRTRARYDIIESLQSKIFGSYLGFGGTINLQLGDVKYRIAAHHKFRGESEINHFHPCYKYLKIIDSTADIVCIAHRHDIVGVSQVFVQGVDKVFMRSGSHQYKTNYAWKEGFRGAIARYPMVLLNGTEKRMIAVHNFREGIPLLRSLNKGVK